MFAAVAGPVTPVVPTMIESQVETHGERKSGAVKFADSAMEVSESDHATAKDETEAETSEPSAKRQKLTTRHIGGEELCHLDSEPFDNFEGLDVPDVFDDVMLSETEIDDDCFDNMQYDSSMTMASHSNSPPVWQPCRGCEPEISSDALASIDQEADKIEIQRLVEMDVITTVDKYDGELDVPLSAEMVRT